MRIMTNKPAGEVTLHFDANGSIVVVGNNSVSNISCGAVETVKGARIQQIFWGSGGGDGSTVPHWIVKRGANTVGVFDSTGWVDYAGNGLSNILDDKAALSANLVGTTSGYLLIELQKDSDLSTNDYVQN